MKSNLNIILNYGGSDNISYEASCSRKNHPVGQKALNELGLYDMSGNVMEWCSDTIKAYPGSSWVVKYHAGSYRVIRGGNFMFDEKYCRVSIRLSDGAESFDHIVGFRLAMTP